MGEVRVYSDEFAEEVAALYLYSVRGQKRPPGKSLPRYFTELHFSNPWASPEMPSLVYLEKGKVTGMIGVVPREMEFRGKPIILAIKSMLCVDPDLATPTVAVQLLGRMLKGPQDLSWTDGASGSVSAFWSALGGSTGPLYAFNWIRVLRPFGTAQIGLDRIGSWSRKLKPVASLLTAPADFLLSKIPIRGDLLQAPKSDLSGQARSGGRTAPMYPRNRMAGTVEAFVQTSLLFLWLMDAAAKAKNGNLRMFTVSNTDGVRCGWFIYYAMPGGASWVMQIGNRKKEDFPNILAALLRDAWEQGSVCVKGASIPQYLTALTEQHCFFRFPQNRVVIHSRHPEILNCIRFGEAAMTRLDGSSWLRFSRENWTD